MGYRQSVRTGGNWTGDYFIIDAEEIDNAENASDVNLRRVKEIVVPDGTPNFPLANGSLQQPSPGARRRHRKSRYLWSDDLGGAEQDASPAEDEAEEKEPAEERRDETDPDY